MLEWIFKNNLKYRFMSRKYFFQKASDLSSEELLQILVDIDNGFYDKELDLSLIHI